jgi:hypothetical protein
MVRNQFPVCPVFVAVFDTRLDFVFLCSLRDVSRCSCEFQEYSSGLKLFIFCVFVIVYEYEFVFFESCIYIFMSYIVSTCIF